ncbi:hypothetical protein E4U58_000741, partial [Claviceps cyperi]
MFVVCSLHCYVLYLEFWNALKRKYEEANPTTVTTYMTKLHNFIFEPEMGIDTAWATLK